MVLRSNKDVLLLFGLKIEVVFSTIGKNVKKAGTFNP